MKALHKRDFMSTKESEKKRNREESLEIKEKDDDKTKKKSSSKIEFDEIPPDQEILDMFSDPFWDDQWYLVSFMKVLFTFPLR